MTIVTPARRLASQGVGVEGAGSQRRRTSVRDRRRAPLWARCHERYTHQPTYQGLLKL